MKKIILFSILITVFSSIPAYALLTHIDAYQWGENDYEYGLHFTNDVPVWHILVYTEKEAWGQRFSFQYPTVNGGDRQKSWDLDDIANSDYDLRSFDANVTHVQFGYEAYNPSPTYGPTAGFYVLKLDYLVDKLLFAYETIDSGVVAYGDDFAGFDYSFVTSFTDYYPDDDNPVPEPATMLLLGAGLLGLVGFGRKRFKK